MSALKERGATVMVHDPLYEDAELERIGFTPYHLGEEVDAAIIQTDHADYRDLTPEQLPGVRSLVDGRNITDANRWGSVSRRVIGLPAEQD